MCSGNWNVYFSISLMKTYHWPCRMLVFQVGVGWKLAQMPSILQSLGEEPPSLLSLLRFCLFLFIIYHPHYWAAVSKTYTEFLVMRLPRWCVKNPLANAGDIRDQGSILGLGRSPGGGHGNPLQYSCLENPRGREAWRATVHRVAKSQTKQTLDWMYTFMKNTKWYSKFKMINMNLFLLSLKYFWGVYYVAITALDT